MTISQLSSIDNSALKCQIVLQHTFLAHLKISSLTSVASKNYPAKDKQGVIGLLKSQFVSYVSGPLNGVSNDGQYRTMMFTYVIIILYCQRGEHYPPSPLPQPSNPSAYRLNCKVDARPCHTTNASYTFIKQIIHLTCQNT